METKPRVSNGQRTNLRTPRPEPHSTLQGRRILKTSNLCQTTQTISLKGPPKPQPAHLAMTPTSPKTQTSRSP
ncbi:hypothetical protein B0T18DRAFT_414271 [Schizothecium vesticola]|uniref:Uncharacterized protein n=1 Tax=Schizothecium vesticola TaxID=314040 RepID=A0AA40EPC7_9PEZI|nr:hypothetical protein B0T18DRAFT_414271 [Schizothecium vesticola]